MRLSRFNLAEIGAVFLAIGTRCHFDDETTVVVPSTSGGVASTRGRATGGEGYRYSSTGGTSPWIDAGPLCVENLPAAVEQVETHRATDVANCKLVLEEQPWGATLFRLWVYIDCESVSASAEDGGLNWSYQPAGHELTLGAALCDMLATGPSHRIDVSFEYIVLP